MGRGKQGTRWLDIRALCSSYLAVIGATTPTPTTLENVYYFSALATHLLPPTPPPPALPVVPTPNKVTKHLDLIRCMEDTGVKVELGRFKAKKVNCNICGGTMIRHEEKETDVAIAVKLFEICLRDECDLAVVITGDTDVSPAIRSVQRLCAGDGKKVWVAFPYYRVNAELQRVADGWLKMAREQYTKFQFPDPYPHSDGTLISKPPNW